MPSMNFMRINHSSCSLGSNVYVFCGYDPVPHFIGQNGIQGFANVASPIDNDRMIECFDNSRPDQPWRLLNLKIPSRFLGRTDPIVCKLNDSQIVILGGLD